MCNKLASRHVRVGLANPSDVPRCDICENAPAFFYCEIDGSSLCLQCDMVVHVGGDKPAHIDETRRGQNHPRKTLVGEKQQNHKVSPVHGADAAAAAVGHLETDTKMIDLNIKPHRIHGQASNNQEDGPNNQTLMQVMYGKHYRCGIPISAYRWAKKLIRIRRSRWSTDDDKW
ncbi:hypothetical protein Godav_005899 [Gossypium davidsonii]|uniref:B box-type domain-containing protein n=1 Tax=Gossypium davidsonii TaxID=34287 RepID=A0A7J8S3I2_GOSDV|nr:hypothetical protein [Gossypium davidsonii]